MSYTHAYREDGKVELLTKGDNNRVGDRGLYAPGQLWLNREDILGRAAGCVDGIKRGVPNRRGDPQGGEGVMTSRFFSPCM